MKKKSMMAFLLTMVVAASTTGCGHKIIDSDSLLLKEEDLQARTGCVEGCTCTGCICCGTLEPDDFVMEETEETSESIENIQPESTLQEEESSTIEPTQTQEEPQTESGKDESQSTKTDEHPNTVLSLSEGELAARREQQANFAEARQTLYSLANSMDKTIKINQMDRQILANNAYNFGTKNVVFIGDSITEGITSAIDDNGNFVSYVTYANSYLHFNTLLNHGKGGRMFTQYGGDELSITTNFGNVTNINSDVIVVFAGVNDFLCIPENKRFGNVDDKISTSGYCGAVRSFMKQLQQYYSDNEIFFVTMYNIPHQPQCTYSDIDWQPTLNDYMEVQRKLAAEYGFHIIELTNIGFMDCTTQEASDYFLRDNLHPKDNGNIVLGEHIAAELSLYFSQK